MEEVVSYACAPSDKAINGNKDQSFSVVASVPSSPMHNSISGPLSKTRQLLVDRPSVNGGRVRGVYRQQQRRHQQTHPGLLPGQHLPSMVKINHHHNGILAILLARHGDRSIVMQIVTGSTSKGEGQAGRIARCTIVFKNSNAVVPRESVSSHMPKNRRRRKNS